MSRSDPSVKVTIYLPKSLHQSSKEMSMVLLYLNRTYKTEVNFNKFPRERVEIYGESGAARRLIGRPPSYRPLARSFSTDVVDANHYVNKAMCRSRYSCQHTCDPGLGYRCMCERGYELVDNIRCKGEAWREFRGQLVHFNIEIFRKYLKNI